MSPEFRNKSWMRRLPVFGLLAAALSVSALAQSVQFPSYYLGENQNGTHGPNYPSTLPEPWVVSSGQIITPAGIPVYLGITTRAKAVALNPLGNGTAAVLQMGAPQSVSIFCVAAAGCQSGTYAQGQVIQNYKPFGSKSGSSVGITYTSDGLHLLFSQDGGYGPAYVAIANVNPTTGMLTDFAHVGVSLDVNADGWLTTVDCFPNSPPGTTGSFAIPCGQTVSLITDGAPTAYPMGIAVSPDNKTAYVVLDNNDTLAKIDLTVPTPEEGDELRVGQVPHSVIISADGTTAYVSNEGGRVATSADTQQGYSNGTPVVVNGNGSINNGTVSVVNLASFNVTATLTTSLHPTGMALWGKYLLVADAYSDVVTVFDTTSNTLVTNIGFGLPISVPGSKVGVGPNSISVDSVNNIAYVALYNANAVAVIDLGTLTVAGLIPVGYGASSVVLDATDGVLLVANDKGIGTTGFAVAPPPMNTAENSYATEFGVVDLNTHQDLGTVSIVPIPNAATLATMTTQVYQNNHWDLLANIESASGGNPGHVPLAIPNKIGSPSKIKHVFVIIRENRTYDQMLGDVAGGNGDPSLAVFGDGSAAGGTPVSPNAHALVQRFPLLDNFYDPSRQSADGHNWITQAFAPYSDDIQSPDWQRDYPSNGGDALAYQKSGHLWDAAARAGVTFKNFGEYIEYNTFNPPQGCTPTDFTQANKWNGSGVAVQAPFVVTDSCEPQWIDFYNDITAYECGAESQLYNFNTVASHSPLPNLINNTVQNYPQFDLGIPDQFRFDIWNEQFQSDLASSAGVPQLEFMWISSDHTGGPATAQAMQADNDLALGRFVEAISHSSIWSSSAIFVEEDDAQTGVDHVDGHRSPGYVISPYVIQINSDEGGGVIEDSTFYTQVNMTRTIEQILGIPPMNQFDLTASPMRTIFTSNPPPANFAPWTHVPNAIPLNSGVSQTPTQTIPACTVAHTVKAQSTRPESPAVKALRAGWMAKKAEVFAGKQHIPDSEDSDTVNHLNWYEATGFIRPYPGEKTVRSASEFNNAAPTKADNDD